MRLPTMRGAGDKDAAVIEHAAVGSMWISDGSPKMWRARSSAVRLPTTATMSPSDKLRSAGGERGLAGVADAADDEAQVLVQPQHVGQALPGDAGILHHEIAHLDRVGGLGARRLDAEYGAIEPGNAASRRARRTGRRCRTRSPAS